jgi:hypothetical protein
MTQFLDKTGLEYYTSKIKEADANLQSQINDLKSRGRYLSLWNASTGLAESNPPTSPYVYQPGDYFIVGEVADEEGETNKRPTGLQYETDVPSTVVETEELAVDDTYYFDGSTWHLQKNTQKTLTFENIVGDPYANTELADALNAKQDNLTNENAGEGIEISVDSETGKVTISNTNVSGEWGQIRGTLSDQTDLQEALDSKLDKSSETEKVYGTDNNGNQVVYSAGENIEFYNKSPQVFPGTGDVSYTEVGSLKAEDEQYIDTGLNYHNEVKGPTYDITFRYINLAGDYANGAIFAGRGVEGRWGIGIDSYSRELRIIHGGGSIYNRTGITTDTNWHRVYSTYDPNVGGGTTYYYYDGELIFQTTKAFKTDATNTNMTIFMFGAHTEFGYNSQASTVEIASFKWYDANGNAVLDYVPAVSSTGEAGFYDKASNTFKTSATGTAPEVEPYVAEHRINAIIPVKDVKVANSSVVDEEGVAQLGSMASESVDNYMTSTEVESALALKQDVIQYSEVPEASAELLGKIIQYTGETTSEYTNGFFYKCFDSHTYEDASAIFVGGDITNLTVNTNTFVNAGVSVDEDHFVHYSESESSWLDEDEQPINLSNWGVSYEGFAVDGDTINIRVNTASTTHYWKNINVQDDNGGIANGVKNQNTAEYAVDPIYDWVGTIEEYNEQNIEEEHPEWVCYITNDNGLPSGGSTSAYVQSVNGKTGSVAVKEFNPDTEGIEGNVLLKTATGYTWGEGGSGKTEDENGNLYISDEFAKDGEDNQYPLIYRTKSVDDSNVIKVNAPVEIEEFEGKSRSLKVSGDLTAKNTKVKSLTIDGTVRAHGNIWMGRTSLKSILYMRCENGEVFHSTGQEGSVYSWYSDWGNTVYTENESPYVHEEQAFSDVELTEPYQWIVEVWEGDGEWDSQKANIRGVNYIEMESGGRGRIDNLTTLTGDNWRIYGGGKLEIQDVRGSGWKIDNSGNFEGKKIRLSSSGNEMGSLHVNGALRVQGESTVTGTSHIKGDIKLDPKDSGNGYSRIYPTENETSSLGTPNHRFEKIYVKDIDISGSGGVDVAHLDGVEEINENTLQFTQIANITEGYYNDNGQYVGDTVSQYINSVDDLPMSIVAFVGANDITYRYGARVNDLTAWHDEVNDTYVYTSEDNVSVGAVVYSDKAMTTLTTVKSVIREPNYTAINGGWSYDGEVEDVAEIGVEPGIGKLIKISDPGNRLLANDLVYEYTSSGNGQWGSYYMYQARTSTASDWSDGVERKWLWFYGRITPGVGTQVYAVCNSTSDPTENALDLSTYKPVVSQVLQQNVQYIKGLTTQGGSNPGDLKLITFTSGGQIGYIWHGQYWDGSKLVDTYAWTMNWQNPRIGDTIYKATYDGGGSKITSEVIGTVTEIYRPDNSVAIDADTGDATKAHNYSQKHFNFYRASLETVPNGDSIPVMEYGGFYGSDWTSYPPIASNWYSQRVIIYPDSNPEGSHIDFNSCTLAVGQSVEIYDMSLLNDKMTEQANVAYMIIEQSTQHPDPSHAAKIQCYHADGTVAGSATHVTINNNGAITTIGIQLTGVTTVDANTFVKIDYQATASTVKYTLNANDPTPTYQTATLIDKSNLVWAFYADSYNTNSSDCLFSLAGGTVNIPGSIIFAPYRFYINSVVRTSTYSTIKKRNPEIGDSLYCYRGNAPIDIPYYDDEIRPVVKARTVVKTYRWKQVSGATTNYCYTFSRNPQLNSYSWTHDKLGGIYSPLESSDIVSSIVPLSVSGIYYLKPTSQYLYYNGREFVECFYHSETQDNVYSDIKLNNFYYWRALDGSYTFLDGKEHEVVSTKSDLPRPDLITISESGQDNTFFIRSPEDDTGNAIAWKKYEDTLIRYTDGNIFVNHVGDTIYANSELSAEIGTILNIAYNYEVIKFNNRNYELDLGNSTANSYYCWTNSDTGEQIYTRTPNPEVNDTVYWDSNFESEAGPITEIVSGEPKAGTFYEVETIPSGESGRYFWNGNIFVEAEKLYKSITIYGEDNDLGKVRTPWNNVYAKSIESPYGTVTTRDGYLEVNGGKITNVTTINYNGADYIYTSVNVVNRITITRSEDDLLLKPVELGLNYCKWQSETNPEIVYYTPDTNVNGEDDLYLDKECSEQSSLVINNVIYTPTQVFTWTSTSGNVVYSLIRQLLEDDEVYDNDLCIRKANPMLITSSQFTDIFQESIIMNNNSITLVLRDINGDVTGSCMLNATKLNKLEQLLQNA